MSTSAKYLIKACYIDILPDDNISVIVDYFGTHNNSNDENMFIIFGIYQWLIKIRGIKENILHKCYLTNRLDELIHKMYKHKSSGYYEMFKKNNIKIGDTNLMYRKKTKVFEILDDDHCPYCKTKGYITENKSINMDCPVCLQFICKNCLKEEEDNDDCVYHKDCYKDRNNKN